MAPRLYAPVARAALADVAKLAALLRGGAVPADFFDEAAAELPLGQVGRVLLLAPTDLGLPPSTRRLVLARGSDRHLLAEVIAGPVDEPEVEAFAAALAAAALRHPGRPLRGWLLGHRFSEGARRRCAVAELRMTALG